MIEILDKGSSTKENKDSNNNNNGKNIAHNIRMPEKYGLRPRTIIKRIQLEKTRQDMAGKDARKAKPPPLSKYRRKTANARERHRMKEINDAFATLRGILPSFSARRSSSSGMTKITTLKLATSYIQALSDVLNDVKKSPSEIHSLHVSHSDSSTQKMLGYSQDGDHTTAEDFFRYHGSRASLSSSSDLGDLLSDDSFENTLDAFDDISTLPEPDPFALFLAGDNSDIL